MDKRLHLEIQVDPLTAEILATNAEQQGLTAPELCALILYQAAATRVGWPGKDGVGLRTAWRDGMAGRERLPFDEP